MKSQHDCARHSKNRKRQHSPLLARSGLIKVKSTLFHVHQPHHIVMPPYPLDSFMAGLQLEHSLPSSDIHLASDNANSSRWKCIVLDSSKKRNSRWKDASDTKSAMQPLRPRRGQSPEKPTTMPRSSYKPKALSYKQVESFDRSRCRPEPIQQARCERAHAA